jgi:hypothetical protein
MTEFADFPTLAWRTIHRRFSGEEKTGLLFNILTIDITTENRRKAILRLGILDIFVDSAPTRQEKKRDELSRTARKKKKPVSGLSRDGLQKSFFDFAFTRFDKVVAFRQRKKERNTDFQRESLTCNLDFYRFDNFTTRQKENQLSIFLNCE